MKNKILEAVFVLAGITLVLMFLYQIKQVLIYIIISAILALIGRPIVKKLDSLKIGKFHIPKSLSVAITILIYLNVLLMLGLSLVPLVNEQASSLSLLNINKIEDNIFEGMSHLNNWLSNFGVKTIDLFGGKRIKELIDFSFIPNFLNSLVGALGGISVGLLTISFITFFFLKDRDLISDSLLKLVPDSKKSKVSNLSTKIKDSLSKYLSGLIVQITVLFLLYTIMLFIAGINNFIIIALLGALLNLIPYVGPLIGFVMMNLLSITGNVTADFDTVIFPMITKISIGYLIIQLVDNFLNQPIIFSKAANAHPLEIFLVILIAGNIGGIIGMVIAVPSYTIIRIIINHFFSEFEVVKNFSRITDEK